LAVEPVKSGGEPLDEYAERQFLRLEELALRREAEAIRVELQKINPINAPDHYQEMFDRWLALDAASRRARDQAEAVGSAS
jgi:DNA primase